MESEEFVTNEYVAACWKVECTISSYVCWYQNNTIFMGADPASAANSYISQHGNTRSLHKGKCSDDVHNSDTFENENNYYHAPEYGPDHQLEFTHDTANHS